METETKIGLHKKLLERIRFFNRRYFNPWSLCFSGRPKSFWSVILHTGRRSGKEYITPIVAVREKSGFIIPLPYGKRVDWFQNIMAAGSCDLIFRGKVYHSSRPEKIPLEEGVGAFPGWVQARLRRLNTEYLLHLDDIGNAPDGEIRYKSFTEAYPRERGVWVLVAIGFLTMSLCRQALKIIKPHRSP